MASPPPGTARRFAAWFLLAALLAGACDDGPSRPRQAAPRRSTTSTTAPATTTTTTTLPAPPPTTAAPDPTTTTAAPTTTTTLPLVLAPPLPGGALAGFVAFGDFGAGPAQGAVADAMERWAAAGHPVDALVTTGDNVYDFGEPHHFAAQLDEPYRELRAAGRPLWVTLGNHDVVYGHGPAQLAYLGLPPLPYAVTLANVRLLFLDGNRPDAEQARWLDEELRRPGPPFSVVVFHQPIHSCGIHGPTPEVAANWAPVLEAHRVALVLNGHEHQYSRFVSANGVTYVITGGGGRDLYPLRAGCAPPELRAAAVRHHFISVEVFDDRLVLTAVAEDGTVLDSAAIPAPAVAAPASAPAG